MKEVMSPEVLKTVDTIIDGNFDKAKNKQIVGNVVSFDVTMKDFKYLDPKEEFRLDVGPVSARKRKFDTALKFLNSVETSDSYTPYRLEFLIDFKPKDLVIDPIEDETEEISFSYWFDGMESNEEKTIMAKNKRDAKKKIYNLYKDITGLEVWETIEDPYSKSDDDNGEEEIKNDKLLKDLDGYYRSFDVDDDE
jgi:hypothetical protein